MAKMRRKRVRISGPHEYPAVMVDESQCICIVGLDGLDGPTYSVSNVDKLVESLRRAQRHVARREAEWHARRGVTS